MTDAKKKGELGEKLVIKYITRKGMEFIESNYHSRFGEIDIVCRDKDCIVFIEVKTRKETSIIRGIECIDKRKQKKIIKTAYIYIQEHDISLQPRFDVAEVRYNNKERLVRINYISNAFCLEDFDEFF